MLFAIDSNGVLYALEPQLQNGNPIGVAQEPIFLNGATSVAIPNPHPGQPYVVTGLAFSTLDYNLWHVTDLQGAATGHGQNPTYDMSQAMTEPTADAATGEAIDGGYSFYFGLENPNDGDEPQGIIQPQSENYEFTNPNVYDTYNLPDGAAGSLETQPFSLANYSTGDAPTLYFEYDLANGGDSAARVFASADGSTWTELTQLGNSNGNWEQAELSLAKFAGDSSVELRFDFSSAGSMQIGDANGGAKTAMYGGAYMTALSGEQINDGDTFIADKKTFAFEMGLALDLPNVAGDVIQNGETFTVTTDSGSTIFQFVSSSGTVTGSDVEIPFIVGETTDQLANEIQNVVNAQALLNIQGVPIVADAYQNRVMLNGATAVTLSAKSSLALTGKGVGNVPAGDIPVPIQSTWSAAQVADEIAVMMDEQFSGGQSLQVAQANAVPVDIVSATESGNTATITTASADGFVVNEQVVIADAGVPGYDGTYTVTSTPTATTFTYILTTSGLAASLGGTAVAATLGTQSPTTPRSS